MRYFFEISYKGTNYHGWQIQKNAITVQEVIQEKLKQLMGYVIEIVGSGRTDTGVHAIQQFFHADFQGIINTSQFKYSMNAILPNDIIIKAIRKVSVDAHARFDALSRRYKYVVILQKDPFQLDEVFIYHHSVDIDKLNEVTNILIGRHDFKSFSKVKTQVSNFKCNIYSAYWQKEGASFVFYIQANRFLRGMVRAIVGTLLMVNEGKINAEKFNDILHSRTRQNAGRSVPAEGLYLSEIKYPDGFFNLYE